MFVTKLGLPEPIANLLRPNNNRKVSDANNKNQQHQSHQPQQANNSIKNPIATPPKPPIKQQQISNNNYSTELNNNNNQKPLTFNGQLVANNLATMTADRRNISTSTVASSGYNSQTNGHNNSSSSYFSQGASNNNNNSSAKMAQVYATKRQFDTYLAASDDPVALLALSHQRRRRQAIRVAAPMVPMMIDDDNNNMTATLDNHFHDDLGDNNLNESDGMLHPTPHQLLHNNNHHHHHNQHHHQQQLQPFGRHRQSLADGSRQLIDDAADDGLTTSMMLDHHFVDEDDDEEGDDDDDVGAESDDVSQFHLLDQQQRADSDELACQMYVGDKRDHLHPHPHLHPQHQTRNAFTTYNARQLAAIQQQQQHNHHHHHHHRLNRSTSGIRQEHQPTRAANFVYQQPNSINLIDQEYQSSSLLYHRPYQQQALASLPPQELTTHHRRGQTFLVDNDHSASDHRHSKSLLSINKQTMQSSGSRQHLSSSPTIDPHPQHQHQQQHSKRKSGHVTNSTGLSNNKQFKSTNNFNSNALLKSSMPKSLTLAASGAGGGGGGGSGANKNRTRSAKNNNKKGHDASSRPALSCCGKLAKLLLFISNALFWLAGIALATWGILALVEDHKYNLSQLLVFEANSTGRMSLFQLLSWSFITLGCATVLVGFCGCSALFKNNRWILGLYIFLVLAIFALDLATGLLAIIFQERLVANVRLRLVNKLRLDYGVQASFTAAIDYIQTKFECCGLDGHFDYDQSVWRLQRLGGFEATVARTCCHLRNTFDDQAHVNPRPVNESMCQSTDVRFHQSYRYRRGCLDDLEKLIRLKIWTFTIGCAAVGVVILISLLFATCFCRSIASKSRKNSQTSIDQDQHDEERRRRHQQVAILNFPDQQTTPSAAKKHHGYSR